MSTHSFTPAQVESLIRLLESSVDVKRRYQFYLWTQGDLQRLVPHKLAVCGAYEAQQRDLAFHVLNAIPMTPEVVATLSDVRSPLVGTVMNEWIKGQGMPLWVDVAQLAHQDASAQGLLDSGYACLLVHAVSRPGRAHEIETFFMFGTPGGEPDALVAHSLHLFLPYLHSIYARVFTNECEMTSSGRSNRYAGQLGAERPPTASHLTEREREILRWVRDGKSNQAIAEELGISALTVKNHVQKILRKLGASNRAQAVAKALMMNVFNTPQSASPTRSTIGLRTPQIGGGLPRAE